MSVASETRYPSLDHAECPYPLFKEFREEGPVVKLEATGEYIVSRHEDVSAALRDTETFSSDVGTAGPRVNDHGYQSMLLSDPPDHTAKRRLAFEPFKPVRLREQTPMVERVVDDVIAAFSDSGTGDFMQEFALPIPIKVTANLMGLPPEDYDQIASWCDLEASGNVYLPPEERVKQQAKDRQMVEYVREAIRARVETPTEDMLGKMVTLQIERDGEYNETMMMAEGANLLLGGIVTTAHLISSALLILLSSPEEMAKTRADYKRIPTLLEEALRVESPVQWRPRRTTVDTKIGDVEIPAESRVLLLLGAANRDERCFHAPEEFDASRKNVKRHMAFGLGTHFCLGAPLARLEGKIAFEKLLTSLSEIKLTTCPEHIKHIPSVLFRSPAELPVAFTRAS
ncbi:MAG: cytochrome P450 [Solirubrobacteraceae bacterium]|nr:cytochrome P450 [Patulibacter sp.]